MNYPISLPLDAGYKPAPFYTPVNITTQTSTLVKTGPGFLASVTIGGPAATGTVAIYDGLTAGGTLLGTLTSSASPSMDTIPLGWYFATGLFVVTAVATQNITVSYA